jgi:hypothetical protein
VTTLAIATIRRDGGTQTRESLDYGTVTDYADAMTEGSTFPAIVVYYDGSEYWLADGFHRVAAAKQIGTLELDAEVIQGSRRDAVLHSVGANTSHGLRRTNADKRRAVETLLRDDEWRQWSDREIARRAQVSDRFVNKLRTELTANIRSENRTHHDHYNNDAAQRSYTTKHGTTATMKTGNIGKAADPRPEPETAPRTDSFYEPEDDDPVTDNDSDDDTFTTVEWASEDIQDYINAKLENLATQTERHEVVNVTLKFVRDLSVRYNKEA